MSFIGRRVESVKRGVRFALSEDRNLVLVAVAAGWFLSLGVRMMYPVLVPYIRTAYSLDLGATGLLLTVLWGAYALGQLPGGVLSDEFGERRVLASSTLLSAVMLTLVIIADHTAVLFITTALFGFTTALYGVARYTAISKVFPERDGTAIGITLAAGNFGNAVLPAIAGGIAAAFLWELGFGFVVPLFVLVGVFLWTVIPQGVTGTGGDTFSWSTARDVFAELLRMEVLLVTAMLILAISVWQTFTGFYPTYLVEVKDLSPTAAAGLYSFFFGLAIVVQPFAGTVYDRLGIRRTLPLFFTAAAVGFALLYFVTGVWALAGVTVLLGCITSTMAVTMPYLTDVLSEEIQGTGLGMLRTTYMLIGAGSPTIFGTIAELGYFEIGFSGLALLVVAMIGIALGLPEQP